LNGRKVVGNTKHQESVLKKLTISFKGCVVPVPQLTGALGDTPVEGQ